MPAVYYYSKRYGNQGAPVRNPQSTDYFSISVALSGTVLQTRLADLGKMANFLIRTVKSDSFNFQTRNGLMGNGIPANPLKVDEAWVEANFINSKYWPFSQIGDPSETNLTISGSYFSVTYPFGGQHYPPTAFVEGNGDMRILRHVSNGEDQRVTYATWKAYKSSSIATLQCTDIVYNPPGLAAGEYIHNVFQMSQKAMIAEIWIGVTFKEYVFIQTNGTAIAAYHTLLRMGNGPTDVFSGLSGVSVEQRRTNLRACGLAAAIVNNRRIMICTLPPTPTGALRTQVAEVQNNGACFLIEGFTVRNSLGFNTNEWSQQTFFTKYCSYDSSDVDRAFYLSDPGIEASSLSRPSGSSPFIKITATELPDNNIGVMFSLYGAVRYRDFTVTSLRSNFCYIYDIANKNIYPEPQTGNDRMYQVDVNANGTGHRTTGPRITYAQGAHYYAAGYNYQLLPTGDRLVLLATNDEPSILPRLQLHAGNGAPGVYGAMNDNNFDAPAPQQAKVLILEPPTPVYPNNTPILMHGYLVVINSANNSATAISSGSASRLDGLPTDKTYNLLQYNGNSYTPVTGHNLATERIDISGRMPLSITTFRNQAGQLFYHNACWSRFGGDDVCDSSIEANLFPRGKYTWDPALREQISQAIIGHWANGANIPAGFTEVHQWNWLIVPTHMAINRDKVFYKIIISFKTPDASQGDGYRYSSTFMFGGVLNANINVNGDGDCRLTAIDTGMLRFDNYVPITISWNIGTEAGRIRLSAVMMYNENDIRICVHGGWSSSTPSGSNYQGWSCHGIITDNNNSNPVIKISPTQNIYKPVIHHQLGFGFAVNTYGLGAMYGFIPGSEDTLTMASGAYVLGSARPAAGFNLTVTTPVEIYNQGMTYYIPVQSVDLTKINAGSSTAHKNAHFYMYAVLFNETATLKISYTLLPEHNAQIFIGHIYTSDTEITRIETETISRWETARPSPDPLGNALPTAAGVSSSLGEETIWGRGALSPGEPTEYLWNVDDLYDTDGNYETTIVDSYWSTNPLGTDRVTVGDISVDLWYIIITRGPADTLQLNVNSPDFGQDTFEVGLVDTWIDMDLVLQGDGTKKGSYQFRLEDEDEMSFKNSRYQNFAMPSQRAVGQTYTNDTGKTIFISITIENSDDYNRTRLYVGGVEVANTEGYQSSGTGHWWVPLTAIVPPGQTYRVDGKSWVVNLWSELRPIT